MTQEDVKPSELGAYTNNIPNSRGIKKLLSDVKALFTKTGTLETAVGTKQDKLTAGDNITISEDNVISAAGSGEWIEFNKSDIATYAPNYDIMMVKNKKVAIMLCSGRATISSVGDLKKCTPILVGEKDNNNYGILVTNNSGILRTTFWTTTSDISGFDLQYVKLYDDVLDVVIDSTNYTDYIDTTNNVFLKNFKIIYHREGSFHFNFIINCFKGDSEGFGFGESFSFIGFKTITISNILDIINNTYTQINSKYNMATLFGNEYYLEFNDNSVKYYYGHYIDLPAPPVTP